MGIDTLSYFDHIEPVLRNLFPSEERGQRVLWLFEATGGKSYKSGNQTAFAAPEATPEIIAICAALAGPHGPALWKALKIRKGLDHLPDAEGK